MIKNMEKINEIKRDSVYNACCFLEQRAFQGMAIVFGSAITGHCREDSDIDICLKTNENVRSNAFFELYGGLSDCLQDDCDILLYDKVKGHIIDEIEQKGVIVYESQAS